MLALFKIESMSIILVKTSPIRTIKNKDLSNPIAVFEKHFSEFMVPITAKPEPVIP